jgi:hypothetical protein
MDSMCRRRRLRPYVQQCHSRRHRTSNLTRGHQKRKCWLYSIGVLCIDAIAAGLVAAHADRARDRARQDAHQLQHMHAIGAELLVLVLDMHGTVTHHWYELPAWDCRRMQNCSERKETLGGEGVGLVKSPPRLQSYLLHSVDPTVLQ